MEEDPYFSTHLIGFVKDLRDMGEEISTVPNMALLLEMLDGGFVYLDREEGQADVTTMSLKGYLRLMADDNDPKWDDPTEVVPEVPMVVEQPTVKTSPIHMIQAQYNQRRQHNQRRQYHSR